MIVRYIFMTILAVQLLFGESMSIDDRSYQKVYTSFGNKAIKRVDFILKEIDKIEKQTDFIYMKLLLVNKLINKVKYKKDLGHWGATYNATFLELIASGAGDSLDFAFAKYVVLIKLGVDADKFRFFTTNIKGISKLKYDTQNYYVLGYYADNEEDLVILDCYTNKLKLIKVKQTQEYQEIEIPLITLYEMEQRMHSIEYDLILKGPKGMLEVSPHIAP